METGTGEQRDGGERSAEGSPGLIALAGVVLEGLEAAQILAKASAAASTVASCRVEASYRYADGEMVADPLSQPLRADLDRQVRESAGDGPLRMPGNRWAWAFGLRHQGILHGCLAISAARQPDADGFLLLTILTRQAGAALGFAELLQRHAGRTEQLANVVERLERRAAAHEVLSAALAEEAGEQGIAQALHHLTGLPVAIEDRFGNLRYWAGPDRPADYPKPDPRRRWELLHDLGAHGGPVRFKDRMSILVRPHADILAVLSVIEPGDRMSDDQLFALEYASTVLGFELSHQRHLAEMELNVRRELVDDLLAGTDADGAYARAEALGHDLRRRHCVTVVHDPAADEGALATALGRAAALLDFEYLLGRHAGFVVLITAGRPEPDGLHRELSRQLGRSSCAIGIGQLCETPPDIPASFDTARRALNVRLHSAAPAGASSYDELGFYRLIDSAEAHAAAQFVREWLGALIDYDTNKHSSLVLTLSAYLESGGSYDEAAATLRVHRSTLRYRLSRISEVTGHDLRNVDTRFNLHAATRAWRFLNPASQEHGPSGG